MPIYRRRNFFRRRKVGRLFHYSSWKERKVQDRKVLMKMRQEELRNLSLFQEKEPGGGNCLRRSISVLP